MTEDIKLTSYSKGGGCGCKIAPSVLQQIVQMPAVQPFSDLLVGHESNDDAAVYQINEQEAIISTTDFFLPIVDDAFDFGRIAAANAISDVYAMGGSPIMAIAILGWPVEKIPAEIARMVLEGGRSICQEAGIPLAGGHTIDSIDPIFGLAVTGKVHISHLKKNNTAKEGDLIFLTKPLGVGILSTAQKRGVLTAEHYKILIRQMTTLNKAGEILGKETAVHAMTDVTGFGFLGHLAEMTEGSGLSAEVHYSMLPKIEALDDYLKLKTIPDATSRNWNSYSKKIRFEKGVNVMEAFNLLPDPQTNGGLMIAVSAHEVDHIKTLFESIGLGNFSHAVGRFIPREEKNIIIKE